MNDVAESVRTALLVPVPAAEPVVDAHRRRLDPSAGWGVPAHITLLFPFLPPADLSSSVVTRIEGVVRKVRAVEVALRRTTWFGDQVLWLAPDPADPFEELIATLSAAFPECPPYGGTVGAPVPHLTIGDRRGGASLADLRRAEAALRPSLPIPAAADRVLLMSGRSEPGSWRTEQVFPLGGSP